jgi:hypothetical protein
VNCRFFVEKAAATWLAFTVFHVNRGRSFVSVQLRAATHGLLGTENRKRLPFAVAGYFRYKYSPVGIERAHNMVTQFLGITTPV